MVLLALESTRLFDNLFDLSEGYAIQTFIGQFFHNPWHGLRFWDLIQPGFMSNVDKAIPFKDYLYRSLLLISVPYKMGLLHFHKL